MANEFEDEIRNEVFSDKLNNFFKKYKKIIILVSILIISIPICLQFYLFFQNQKKQTLLSEYLKAEIMLDLKNNEAILILNKLKNSNNEIISILSLNKLLDYYLLNNKDEAIKLLNNYNFTNKQSYFNELQNIKKVILNFDKINENQILNFLSTNDDSKFKNIKKKLLYDFYVKNNKVRKAKQIYGSNK